MTRAVMPASVPCSHCGDLYFNGQKCELCGLVYVKCCPECHLEIWHGKISKIPANTGVNGGDSAYRLSDRQYHGGFYE